MAEVLAIRDANFEIQFETIWVSTKSKIRSMPLEFGQLNDTLTRAELGSGVGYVVTLQTTWGNLKGHAVLRRLYELQSCRSERWHTLPCHGGSCKGLINLEEYILTIL